MAEFGDSLLHFDNVGLDVNENPSNTENLMFTDFDEIHKFVPSNEITPKCDFSLSKTLQSLENHNNHFERPESINEIFTDVLDPLLQNVVNQQDNSDFSETLHTLISTSDCMLENKSEIKMPDNANGIKMPENTNEIEILENKNEIQVPENKNEILINNEDFLPLDLKEHNTNKRNSDSGIHDSENNIVEDVNVLDFTGTDLNMSDDFKNIITEFSHEENDVQFKDEEFHDAVQFFKDPSSLAFLENAGSANAPAEPLMTRSSLYVNFDPLHAKFYSQPAASNDLQGIAEDDVEPEVMQDAIQSDIVPDVVNKHLTNISPRESLGNILISFDSPLSSKEANSQSVDKPSEPQKLYTEEELQQALKIQELSLQETFLKKQQDLELTRSQKQQELETRVQAQSHLCKAFSILLKEVTDIVTALSEKEKILQEKVEIAEKENIKLKEDLKTSVEDLQSVETTFSDFHKRYENCKSMLKVYIQNEESLKQNLENLKVQLQEKEEMYKALQSRTEEMLDKANMEVANVKKAGDAQVAVLNAQLKKAELKISSLESDVKHVKIENGKLSSICDELMAKVSEG